MPAKDDSFGDYVLDQLRGLAAAVATPDGGPSRTGLERRRMFGGSGFYFAGTFFAILWRERLFFKVGDADRGTYEALGMQPFRPTSGQTLSSYYEVPTDVLEDEDQLVEWARRAIRAAREAAARKGAAGASRKRVPRAQPPPPERARGSRPRPPDRGVTRPSARTRSD